MLTARLRSVSLRSSLPHISRRFHPFFSSPHTFYNPSPVTVSWGPCLILFWDQRWGAIRWEFSCHQICKPFCISTPSFFSAVKVESLPLPHPIKGQFLFTYCSRVLSSFVLVFDPLLWFLSSFHVRYESPGNLLKCRIWLDGSGVWVESLHF